MGLISKISTIATCYIAYKVVMDDNYKEVKELLFQTTKLLKPYILNIIDIFEFSYFGPRYINENQKNIEIEKQLFAIKKAIADIDTTKTAKNIVKTIKNISEK